MNDEGFEEELVITNQEDTWAMLAIAIGRSDSVGVDGALVSQQFSLMLKGARVLPDGRTLAPDTITDFVFIWPPTVESGAALDDLIGQLMKAQVGF